MHSRIFPRGGQTSRSMIIFELARSCAELPALEGGRLYPTQGAPCWAWVWGVCPLRLRRSKIFFFHFPARERLGIFPHWFGAPPGSYFERYWVRSGGSAYTSMAYTSCLARLAILTHSGRTSVGVASGHVPVRRFLLPVAILTRFDASFGGAVLRRARHAPPARPQAVRLPRLSAEGVRDGGATRLSGHRCPITPRRLKHVASYPHPLSSGAAFTMQTVHGGFPAPGLGSGGEPMFARPPGRSVWLPG